MEEPDTNTNGDNAKPENQPPVPSPTPQTDRDKPKSEPAKGTDGESFQPSQRKGVDYGTLILYKVCVCLVINVLFPTSSFL